MKKILIIIFLIFFNVYSVVADDNEVVKETYKLQGTIEYDDNPVETIFLDENIEKPQINIPKRSLSLPVSMLNITSNTNSQKSALARTSITETFTVFVLTTSSCVKVNVTS